MNAIKITYVICSVAFELALLVGAVITPIYATPGYYYWTALFILFVFASSNGFTRRLNSWEGMGDIET